jgi:transcriptional regulator with AAA-type ATPase domain
MPGMPRAPDETLPREESTAQVSSAALAPELFLLLECDRPLAGSVRYSLADLSELAIGRGEERAANEQPGEHGPRLLVSVPDQRISSVHARLVESEGSWLVLDNESRNGVMLNGALTRRAALADGDVLELGHTFFVFRQATPGRTGARRVITISDFSVRHPVLLTLVWELGARLAALSTLAPSSVPVVIEGESGTGKELIARAIHELSGRPGAFVAINCGALPASLLESELFGYRKGAFSGALEDRQGLIRAADRGTLFLDEIGDLPTVAQAAFLRALQEHEITPLGATRPLPVDLRVIAATHRDLRGLVQKGTFRDDLLARLAGARVTLPPLRERTEDLGIILATLLQRLAGERAPRLRIAVSAARSLIAYDWPRNVRELEKSLETALLLAESEHLQAEHLPEAVRRAALDGRNRQLAEGQSLLPEERAQRAELIRLLAQYDQNISAVARHLGKGRTQIQRWLRRYGLKTGPAG